MKLNTKREPIVHASGEEIARRLARGEDRSDWERGKTMSQAEVERLADEEDADPFSPSPPIGGEGRGEVGVFSGERQRVIPAPKKDIHIRLDADIVDWFKARHGGYQTYINAVLRAFVQSR